MASKEQVDKVQLFYYTRGMITYSNNLFFIAHWFVDQPSAAYRKQTGVPNMNWIAALWRNPDGSYEMRFRFSYWDEGENYLKSSWHGAKSKSGRSIEQMIAGLDILAKMNSERNGNSFWERVDLNLFGDKAMEELLKKDWFNIVDEYKISDLN